MGGNQPPIARISSNTANSGIDYYKLNDDLDDRFNDLKDRLY